MLFSRFVGNVHLYAGLFLAPFAVLFASSVLVLNHAPVGQPGPEKRRVVSAVAIPAELEVLEGRARIERLRPVLDGLGVKGEVGPIRFIAKEARMVIPVTVPAEETMVELDLRERSASITSRNTGILRGSVYLHKMPGPHLVAIKGNWAGMRVWRVFADAAVYLFLLATATGIWIWWPLRSQRRPGLIWFGAGTVVFVGVICALAL